MTMKKTVALLAFVAGVLAGSASAAMTHTAATIDTRADVLMDELPEGTPVKPMIDDDGQLVIVLSTNITGSLTIPADLGSVTLDLNGWSIVGGEGPTGGEGTTTDGDDGEDGKATPQSLWIADHADAGEGYVNLAIQVNLPTGTTLTAELAEKYGANFKAVCAATEADFDKATPQPVTFVKLANGLIWVKVAVPAIDSRLLWKVACPKL